MVPLCSPQPEQLYTGTPSLTSSSDPIVSLPFPVEKKNKQTNIKTSSLSKHKMGSYTGQALLINTDKQSVTERSGPRLQAPEVRKLFKISEVGLILVTAESEMGPGSGV